MCVFVSAFVSVVSVVSVSGCVSVRVSVWSVYVRCVRGSVLQWWVIVSLRAIGYVCLMCVPGVCNCGYVCKCVGCELVYVLACTH